MLDIDLNLTLFMLFLWVYPLNPRDLIVHVLKFSKMSTIPVDQHEYNS